MDSQLRHEVDSQISVSDLLSVMTLNDLRLLVIKARLAPYMRSPLDGYHGYWKTPKPVLIKKLSPFFVIVIENDAPYLERIVDDYHISLKF